MKSIIYFIGIKGQPFIKIGKTTDIIERISSFYTALPFVLENIGEVAGSYNEEKLFHKTLRRSKIWGEWFDRKEAVRLLNCLKSSSTIHDAIDEYNKGIKSFARLGIKTTRTVVSDAISKQCNETSRKSVATTLGISLGTVSNALRGNASIQAPAAFNLLINDPTALDPLLENFGRSTAPMQIVSKAVRLLASEGGVKITDNECLQIEDEVKAAIEALEQIQRRCHEIREKAA